MFNVFAKYHNKDHSKDHGEYRCPRCKWLAKNYSRGLQFWINTPPDITEGTLICTNTACENFAAKFQWAADLPKMEYGPAWVSTQT